MNLGAMPSEAVGTCGVAQWPDREQIARELEFGIACLRHHCGPEPPGCSLEVVWHDHDSGAYAEIELVWEQGVLFEEHWKYIERCSEALDQLGTCVDWEALHAMRERRQSERLTTPTAPSDSPAETVTLKREPLLLRLFLRWTLLGGSLLVSLSLTVLGTVGMIEEGPTPGGFVGVGFLVCFGGLSVGIFAHDQDGDRVPKRPQHTEAHGTPHRPLSRHEGSHSDHEVGIGGVSHSEKESESQGRQQRQH